MTAAQLKISILIKAKLSIDKNRHSRNNHMSGNSAPRQIWSFTQRPPTISRSPLSRRSRLMKLLLLLAGSIAESAQGQTPAGLERGGGIPFQSSFYYMAHLSSNLDDAGGLIDPASLDVQTVLYDGDLGMFATYIGHATSHADPSVTPKSGCSYQDDLTSLRAPVGTLLQRPRAQGARAQYSTTGVVGLEFSVDYLEPSWQSFFEDSTCLPDGVSNGPLQEMNQTGVRYEFVERLQAGGDYQLILKHCWVDGFQMDQAVDDPVNERGEWLIEFTQVEYFEPVAAEANFYSASQDAVSGMWLVYNDKEFQYYENKKKYICTAEQIKQALGFAADNSSYEATFDGTHWTRSLTIPFADLPDSCNILRPILSIAQLTTPQNGVSVQLESQLTIDGLIFTSKVLAADYSNVKQVPFSFVLSQDVMQTSSDTVTTSLHLNHCTGIASSLSFQDLTVTQKVLYDSDSTISVALPALNVSASNGQAVTASCLSITAVVTETTQAESSDLLFEIQAGAPLTLDSSGDLQYAVSIPRLSSNNAATGTYTFEVSLQDFFSSQTAQLTLELNVVECTLLLDSCPTDSTLDFVNKASFAVQPTWTLSHPSCSIASFACTVATMPPDNGYDLCANADPAVAFFDISDGSLTVPTLEPSAITSGSYVVEITATLSIGVESAPCQIPINIESASEPSAVQSLVNNEPHFEPPLQMVYEFDLLSRTDALADSQLLGEIVDLEGDSFEVTKTLSPVDFLAILQTERNDPVFEVQVDWGSPQVQAGSFTLSIELLEQVDGEDRKTKILIQVDILEQADEPQSDQNDKSPESETIDDSQSEGSDVADANEGDTESGDDREPLNEYSAFHWDWIALNPELKPIAELPEDIQELNKAVPKPVIQRVTNAGHLSIQFGEQRFKEPESSEGQIGQRRDLRRTLENDEPSSDELILKQYVKGRPVNGTDPIPGVTVLIEVGQNSVQEDLLFEYSISVFDASRMDLQLKFEKPASISTDNVDKEFVLVELRDFRDTEGNLICEDQDLKAMVPAQMSAVEAAVAAAIGGAASGTIGATTIINVILNFLKKGSMGRMLGAVKFLQVVVHVCLMYRLIKPAITEGFIAEIFGILKFDIIDLNEYGIDIFEGARFAQEPDNSQQGDDDQGASDDAQKDPFDYFSELGYESFYFLLNLGSLIFVVTYQFIRVALLWILQACPKRFTRLRRYSRSSLDKCFFNSFLTFIDGVLIVLLMSSAINIFKVSKHGLPADVNFFISVLSLGVCIAQLLGVTGFLLAKRRQLDSPRNKERCGYIYSDLNYRVRGLGALSFPIFYQVRFFVLAWVLLFLMQNLVVQVLVVTLATIIIMAVLGMAHPFQELRRNYTSLAAEFTVIITIDLLFACSDPVLPAEQRQIVGWMILVILSLSLLLSVGSILYASVKDFLTLYRLKKIRKASIENFKKKQLGLKHIQKRSCDTQVQQGKAGPDGEINSLPRITKAEAVTRVKRRLTILQKRKPDIIISGGAQQPAIRVEEKPQNQIVEIRRAQRKIRQNYHDYSVSSAAVVLQPDNSATKLTRKGTTRQRKVMQPLEEPQPKLLKAIDDGQEESPIEKATSPAKCEHCRTLGHQCILCDMNEVMGPGYKDL